MAAASADAALAQRRRQILKELIEGMEGKCKEILGLRFLSGHGFTEIKDKLRIPLGTVASRLRRCQADLLLKARSS